MANDTDLIRAAKHLIDVHGTLAANIADQRAMNLAMGGAGAAAHTWRQIAGTIRMIQFTSRTTGRSTLRSVSGDSDRIVQLLPMTEKRS
jgi:hypothetical protein